MGARTDRAADAKAAVILRHKEEWEQHQQLIRAAVENGDFDAAKLAKITAETIKIRQEGERKAWGITDKGETELSGGIAISWQK